MKNYIFIKNKFFNKKFLLIFLLLILALICSLQPECIVGASSTSDTESLLSNSVFDIVNGINLSEIQNVVDNIEHFEIFNVSIYEKLKQILNGEYFSNYSSLLGAIISLVFVDIKKILPFIFTLIAIGLLSNLVLNFKSSNKNVSDIISYVFLSVMIIMILVVFRNILDVTNNSFGLIIKQMQLIFPILITLLTSIGSFSAISIYNPLVAVLTTIVSIVFDKFLYPIFILIFVLTILGSITDTFKLDKLISFLNSTFKWVIGIVFTIFTGFLAIQGISAGKYDSISIKATKFAMKSYIPIIGSYISDGMDFFILGSVLVKNAVGLIGVLILFVSILSPIITILIYKLGIQLSSGILEISGNSRMSNFLNSCSKILIYPIVLILGVAFMYVITICLIMCTANIF